MFREAFTKSSIKIGVQGEWAYWERRLWRKLRKSSAEGITGVGHLTAELDLRRLHSTTTYLGNAKPNLFTVTKLREEGITPVLGMVATSAVEREFREINRRTEVGVRWSDQGIKRAAMLLEEVRLNGTKLEF